jgi:hypothetical protein
VEASRVKRCVFSTMLAGCSMPQRSLGTNFGFEIVAKLHAAIRWQAQTGLAEGFRRMTAWLQADQQSLTSTRPEFTK